VLLQAFEKVSHTCTMLGYGLLKTYLGVIFIYSIYIITYNIITHISVYIHGEIRILFIISLNI